MKSKVLEGNADSLGRLSIRDKRTGKLWSGGRRRLSVRYFDPDRSAARTVAVDPSGGWDVKRIASSKTRVRFLCVLKKIGLRFEVGYTLHDNSVEVRIPISTVKDGRRHPLMSITPLPRWGAVAAGERGYLFLPNCCGSICPFTVKHRQTQRALLYGRSTPSKPNTTGMAVFGIVHDASAFLGIVTSGQFDTEQIAETNAGPGGVFSNFISFHYRYQSGDVIDPVDRTVRYVCLADDEATYVGMAKAYRRYVLNEKRIPTMRERARKSPALRYHYRAFNDIRLDLGIKNCGPPGQKGDGKGTFNVFQTFLEAKDAVSAVRDAGIDKAAFILVGLTPDGADGLYPTKLPPDPRLGGREGLIDLIRHAKSLGYRTVNWDNYTDSYENSPDWSPGHIQKNRDGSFVTPYWYWAGGLAYKICPEEGLKLARKTFPRMKKLGMEGAYLCDAMPVGLFNCFDGNHGHAPVRRAVAEGYQRIASLARKTFGGCHCENFQDYMAGCADVISHIPVHRPLPPRTQPRRRAFHECFLNEFVPFYQIVYHGIVQYHIMPHWFHRDEFLNEIEVGAVPRCNRNDAGRSMAFLKWLKSSLPTMKRQYDVLCCELGHLQFEFIENHRKIARRVSETTYSDGTRVLVNYRYKDFVCDGRTIEARGYRHVRPAQVPGQG